MSHPVRNTSRFRGRRAGQSSAPSTSRHRAPEPYSTDPFMDLDPYLDSSQAFETRFRKAAENLEKQEALRRHPILGRETKEWDGLSHIAEFEKGELDFRHSISQEEKQERGKLSSAYSQLDKHRRIPTSRDDSSWDRSYAHPIQSLRPYNRGTIQSSQRPVGSLRDYSRPIPNDEESRTRDLLREFEEDAFKSIASHGLEGEENFFRKGIEQEALEEKEYLKKVGDPLRMLRFFDTKPTNFTRLVDINNGRGLENIDEMIRDDLKVGRKVAKGELSHRNFSFEEELKDRGSNAGREFLRDTRAITGTPTWEQAEPILSKHITSPNQRLRVYKGDKPMYYPGGATLADWFTKEPYVTLDYSKAPDYSNPKETRRPAYMLTHDPENNTYGSADINSHPTVIGLGHEVLGHWVDDLISGKRPLSKVPIPSDSHLNYGYLHAPNRPEFRAQQVEEMLAKDLKLPMRASYHTVEDPNQLNGLKKALTDNPNSAASLRLRTGAVPPDFLTPGEGVFTHPFKRTFG